MKVLRAYRHLRHLGQATISTRELKAGSSMGPELDTRPYSSLWGYMRSRAAKRAEIVDLVNSRCFKKYSKCIENVAIFRCSNSLVVALAKTLRPKELDLLLSSIVVPLSAPCLCERDRGAGGG